MQDQVGGGYDRNQPDPDKVHVIPAIKPPYNTTDRDDLVSFLSALLKELAHITISSALRTNGHREASSDNMYVNVVAALDRNRRVLAWS